MSRQPRTFRKKTDADRDWDDDESTRGPAPSESATLVPDEADHGVHPDGTDNVAAPENGADEYDRDIRERNEFAERLRLRDKDSTKRLIEDRSLQDDARSDSDAKRRRLLANDTALRADALPQLRERSRQEYLKLREQQQILLLEQRIRDEETLFRDERLTAGERQKLDYDKEVLRLAKARLAIDDRTEGYAMPEDYLTEKGRIDRKRKEAVLFKRYQEHEEGFIGGDRTGTEQADGKFVSEQERWEETQLRGALLHDRAQHRKPEASSAAEDDYEYVFDDQQIQFVLDSTMNAPKDMADMADTARVLEQLSAAERKAATMAQIRASLPVYAFREQLIAAINEYQVLVIVGETGSGKTTQIPQYLHEAGFTSGGRKIGITQPRRVAAMSVAARVAEEVGVKVGYDVGYSIRFEDCTSDKTVIKYMTDGMLLREFLTEPDLAAYSVLMIDEAHERTLFSDILLGLIKDVARFRPDLKILISSATMNAQKFAEYFDDAPIFNIPGRPYPVKIYYTQAPEANYLTAAITTIFQIHISQGPGDILVFLTGQDEIETAAESLQQTCRVLGSRIRELLVCPIYASLPSDQQSKIFEPTPQGARKVILATNIAETSITIDGISFVIDCGFEKQNVYNPRSGMESLIVTPCSRASAQQRAGRAGRVGPGSCFRLYSQWSFINELTESTTPEIQRCNLGNVVLLLMGLGVRNLIEFDFLDPPPAESLIRAYEQLYALGAVNDKGELTKLGRRMAEFPMDPMLSKTVIASEKYHCSEEIASICAMLTVQNSIFYRPKDKKFHADKAKQNLSKPEGDHLTLLNVWNQWVESQFSMQWCYENYIQFKSMNKARDVRDQIVGLLERVEITLESNPDPGDTTPIRKAITAGYFSNSCRISKAGDSYRTLKQQNTVYIHPSSGLFEKNPPWVAYFELVLTSKEYMRQVLQIEPGWLREVAPHYYKDRDLDDESKKKLPKMSRAQLQQQQLVSTR